MNPDSYYISEILNWLATRDFYKTLYVYTALFLFLGIMFHNRSDRSGNYWIVDFFQFAGVCGLIVLFVWSVIVGVEVKLK
mgnify:CR=1 FL=1